MHGSEKPRPFEYSSLVMGSRDIPSVTFPQKRPMIAPTKTYAKKNQYVFNKYSKSRSHKVRGRNERPDIFLEGQQLANTNAAWQKEIDSRYFQNMRDKIRKSTPNAHGIDNGKVCLRGQRTTPSCSDFEEEFGKTTQFKIERRNANSLAQTQHHSSKIRVHSTDRHFTTTNPSLRQDTHNKIALKLGKLQQKAQQVPTEQLKRKQLFYVTQRDLASIRSESFIVVQHPNKQIITGYYYRKVVQIASLTKIMTFYTVLKLLQLFKADPDTTVVQIDGNTAQISGTSAQLYQGDHYSLRQLLHALMLPSGNDAATALARWGGGLLGQSVRDFVQFMNRLATQLGMKSSTFGNPHGLPHPQNGSTAQDVAILIGRCLESQLFRDVVKCRSFRCWTQNQGVRREVIWENTNKLLRRPGFSGIKTGVTVTAGPCLASLYSAGGRNFIVVLLRTSKLSRRFKQTRWILGMSLRRLNFDGGLTGAIRELGREDPELDSDNSEEEQEFNFYRNDTFELDRRRRILLNEL